MQADQPSPSIRSGRATRVRVERSFRNVLRRFVVLAAGLMLVLPAIASAQQRRVVQMRPVEPTPTETVTVDDDPFDRSGFYVGLGGSYQFNPFNSKIESLIEDALDDEIGPGANVKADLGDSGGVNATVGYRAFSFLALEIEYEWIDQYKIKGSTDTPIPVSGDLYSIEGHTLTANTKWIIPFWRIQPYLLIGGGIAISDVNRGSLYDNAAIAAVLDSAGIDVQGGTHTNAAARAGLGLDLYITEHIVVNGEASTVLTTLKEPDLGDIEDLNYISFSAGMQYRF